MKYLLFSLNVYTILIGMFLLKATILNSEIFLKESKISIKLVLLL